MSEPSHSGSNRDPGIPIGVLLTAILVAPQIYWLIKGYSNVHDWELALWGFNVAVVLAVSYFYERSNFLFRGIVGLFRKVHVPRGAGWVLVYSGLFIVIGIYYLLR